MTQTSAGTRSADGPAILDGPLVLGIEANGTAVRAVLADDGGAPAGLGQAGGATPTAYPLSQLSERLELAVRQALGERDPARVAGVVLGIAGYSRIPEVSAVECDPLWPRLGLHCPVRVVADVVASFAAGTCARQGAVLIADAGAIAAWIADETVLARVDGHGWLVGDDGSGFWLGRQAVRAVLAELDGRGEPTLLRPAVLATVTDCEQFPSAPGDQLELLRGAVYDQPPIALARLAPLVPAAAEAGDRVAQRILDRALTLLTDALDALFAELPASAERPAGAERPATARDGTAPIVLSGSLLRAPGPIQREVCRRTEERYGRAPVVARGGAGGAAWLALHRVAPDLPAGVHTQLTLVDDRD